MIDFTWHVFKVISDFLMNNFFGGPHFIFEDIQDLEKQISPILLVVSKHLLHTFVVKYLSISDIP